MKMNTHKLIISFLFVDFCFLYTQKIRTRDHFPAPTFSTEENQWLMNPRKKKRVDPQLSETKLFLLLHSFAFVMVVLAFFFNSPQEYGMVSGLFEFARQTLWPDYIESLNAGAAFLNVSIMTLEHYSFVRLCKAKITGPVIAGNTHITGLLFFGKKLL